MWRQVVAQSPGENAPTAEVLRYDIGWKALNTMLKSGRSLSGHERNCCFLNTRGSRFADISAAASLDMDDDGRVLALSDWDFDGDLDFWIANRTGPQTRFLRNEAGNGKNYVAFRLIGTTCNRDAIGARVELTLVDGQKRIKTLRAGEGYLAQNSKWLSFGLGDETRIEKVVVTWPGGSQETIGEVTVNSRFEIQQNSGTATPWSKPDRKLALRPSEVTVPASTEKSRIVLISALPLPAAEVPDIHDGSMLRFSGTGKPRLINFWATWCQPCLKELSEWKQHAAEFQQRGIEVVTINVDEPAKDRAEQKKKIRSVFDALKLPFRGGFGTNTLVNQFDVIQRAISRRQKPPPVPSSFLIDGTGSVRVIYKGPVEAKQVLADADLLSASPEQVVAASVPYRGKWLNQPGGTSPNVLATRFVEGGFVEQAEAYLRQLAATPVTNPMFNPTDAMVLLGAILVDQKKFEQAADAFRGALQASPNHRQSHLELAAVLSQLSQHAEAAEHYAAALERRQNDPELRTKLAMALLNSGKPEQATKELALAINYRPSAAAHHQLGNILISLGRTREAVENFRKALALQPEFGPAANNLAWLLATHEDVLSPAEAVLIAEQLVRQPRDRTSGNLDTLAAAYAADGQFDQAVEIASEAIKVAKLKGDIAKSERIENRRSLYQQGEPFRE